MWGMMSGFCAAAALAGTYWWVDGLDYELRWRISKETSIHAALTTGSLGFGDGTLAIDAHSSPTSPKWLVAADSHLDASRAWPKAPRRLEGGDREVNATNSTDSSRNNRSAGLIKTLLVVCMGLAIVLSSILLGTMIWHYTEQRHEQLDQRRTATLYGVEMMTPSSSSGDVDDY